MDYSEELVDDPGVPSPCSSRDVTVSSNMTVSEIDLFSDQTDSSEEYTSDEEYQPSDDGSESSIGESLVDELEDNFDYDDYDLAWDEDPNSMKTFIFSSPVGLRVPIPGENKPADFFQLLFDDVLLESIVKETNSYAKELFLSKDHSEKSRISSWKNLTLNEFKVFLGLLLHMGHIKLPKIQDYWKKDKLFKTCFGEYMARDRFLLILRCLHFVRADATSTDRLHKIRSIVDYFNNKMINIYNAGKELSLDEAMVLWRGRLAFKQYIKGKRHKYGIKLYVLTEPNGLILKFAVYAGALDQLAGEGHASKVVMYLMREKLGRAHSIYMDNFYNSIELATELLEEKTYTTGTLRADRKKNPKTVVNAKVKKGESVEKYYKGVMCGKWRDKRTVLYLSTQYYNEMGTATNKRGQEKLKPYPIIKYNEYMKGVDRQDQFLSYYPCERKTLRWYKKLFVHILQMSVLNAFFLFNKHTFGKKLPLLEFRLEVIRHLLSPVDIQNQRPRKVATDHLPTKNPVGRNNKTLRRRCVICYTKGIRKDSVYQCEGCAEKPALCLGDCFKEYHG
ncbi:piggyBac transposable element-derived protein 4-like [Macrosteles quadrilineatus]|uniref:piggyBac transposable element-derived protein 4-like n=1 Tax=Macrosteles quadrilineatus TaxID=74068 RepID=UPI0023E14268|nr:piggyBac transposable element-derived protein 4-like [Macrosteles quadrilineatus]